MNQIFDTHSHYDSKEFDEDRDLLLNTLPEKNVFAVISAGADIKSSIKSLDISKNYDYIYSAVGIHPENITTADFSPNYLLELEDLILNNQKIVAVGEIGLDYHFNDKNKDVQKEVFQAQIELAVKYDLPVVVHDREAHKDTLDILKKYRPKGIVHCFSGSVEMADEIIKLGMYIGIGGIVTFKNAKTIVDVVKNISLERIVLETDAPYLAPTPFRGKRCDSSYIKYTAERIAELKNTSTTEVLNITKKNAINLFRIK